LIQGLAQAFSSYAERKRISLNVRSAKDSIIAYIDLDKFEKILTNILSNAFKFTPEGGRIDVSVEEGAGNVLLRVTDTGSGIPAENLPRVFDRFYQVDSSQTREQEGTGIGLSLTKELVELHKGKIEIESVEGTGTTVSILLPLGKGHLTPEEICAPSEDEQESPRFAKPPFLAEEPRAERHKFHEAIESGETVLLLVEDNADVREYIRRNLHGGYRILEAVNGEDGWKRSIEEMPDIIVSDVMMPRMDGYELCRKLKTDERTSHIPVVLLTAKASSHDRIEGFETGADDYVMKPFEPEEVEARIRNLLEQRKRIHEHFRKHGLFEIEEKRITPVDQKFLQKAVETINQNISEPSFNVESFAEKLATSRYVLYKKTMSLTGESPIELIRRVRLNKAADLIQKKYGNLSEIALEVGFASPAYFSDCFKKQFGISPSHYQHQSLQS
jgi:DNA-binding response OmpR family regulator/anti-sigma regulatory factor (Ser/Thr protein kinase)